MTSCVINRTRRILIYCTGKWQSLCRIIRVEITQQGGRKCPGRSRGSLLRNEGRDCQKGDRL